jgi:branched-chain amino acid transport system ATP-binding protein
LRRFSLDRFSLLVFDQRSTIKISTIGNASDGVNSLAERGVTDAGASLDARDGISRNVLLAEGLEKRFGGVAAVDNVSLVVRSNEIVGLIGPNGAGKTTLFDLLAGEQKPSAGRILVNDVAVEHAPAHARIGCGLGRTFQIPRPFAGMTLVENVMLGGRGQSGEQPWPNWLTPGRVAREERANFEKAMALLDFVTLAPLAQQPARVLSGGQRKLLELARIMMAEPKILLLDEPAAGVNPALLEVIIERIAAINCQGAAFLIIEHNMEMVARLCSHVFVMASGRMLCEGRPGEVAEDPRVIEAYLGGGAT